MLAPLGTLGVFLNIKLTDGSQKSYRQVQALTLLYEH